MFSAFVLLIFAFSQSANNFNVTTNVHFNKLSSIQVAPDGKTFAFTARKWIEDSDSYLTVLYCQTIEDSEPTALTEDQSFSVSEFVFDPTSSQIAFTRSDDATKLYLIDISTKTITTAKEFKTEISYLQWGASGDIFAFATNVYVGMNQEQTAEFDDLKTNNYHSNAQWYESTPTYRWDTWFTGTYQHVHYMRVQSTTSGSTTTYSFGDATDIMPNYPGDCPASPQGSSSEFSISPDGKYIAWSSQPARISAWSVRNHVYLYSIPADGSTTSLGSVCLTLGRTGHSSYPVFSPDTRKLAITWSESDLDGNEYPIIVIIDLITRQTTTLLEDWDESPSDLVWSSYLPDKIIMSATLKGQTRLFPIDIATGAVDESNTLYSIGSFFLLNSTHVLYTKSTYAHPPDVYMSELVQSTSTYTDTQLTDLNKETLAALDQQLYEPESISYTGGDSDTIQAWYFPPRSLAKNSSAKLSDKSTPLLIWVHGGPESSWTNSWSDRWNPMAFVLGDADLEFAMLLPNIHGSTSFGEAFMAKIHERWGTLPLQDVLLARNATLSKYSYLDPERTAAMGASFGGFMMNLLQGQATEELNPFVCLICHDGLFDCAQHGYESDIFYFDRTEFGCFVWENRTKYDMHSPSLQPGRGNWHTPELIIHGLKDWRVNRGHGIGMFNVLQRARYDADGNEQVHSHLILYPNANHWCTRPGDSIHWHESCINWLNTYLEKEAAAKTMALKRKFSAKYLAEHPQSDDKTEL